MSKDSHESMNEELRRWLAESKKEIKTSKEKSTKAKKPKGKCQICGEKTAEAVCLKCEKFICKSCYFKLIGICKKCVPPEIAGKWDGSHPDWEKELGVEWVG
jgi:late competence protein required for DNA uptake (superfamily II DNA/RNA helicase)